MPDTRRRARRGVAASLARHPSPAPQPAQVGVADPARASYREVLGVREFRAMLVSQVLSTLGDQVARVAVAVLVFARSGSAFAASATYACTYLTWFVAGTPLSALADHYPRRTVMIVADLGRVVLVLLMALPSMPLPAIFLLLVVVGLLEPPFESARSALLPDLLPADRYVVGNALMNLAFQAGQVSGFLLGGVLIGVFSYRGALLVDAATFAFSALVLLRVVRRRPAARGAGDQTTMLAETMAGVRLVAGDQRLRSLLAYALLSAAVVAPPEGLAVAVSSSLGRGSVVTGLLTASVPAGFLLGSALVLRVAPARRVTLLPLLAVLSALPLLATGLLGSAAAVAVVWMVAGAGTSLQLVAGAAFVSSVPAQLRGRAYGVASTLLMAVQGAALLIAGAVAEVVDPRTVVSGAAVVALVLLPVVLLVAPHGSQVAPAPEERALPVAP